MAVTRILITGATGNVGLETLRCLSRLALPATELYAGVPDVAKAREQVQLPGVQVVPLDFARPETVRQALRPIDKVFLLRPPQLADVPKYFQPFVAEAKAAGVRHLVFLSLQGVEHNTITPHYKIEQLVLQSGLPYTFLRPSFFMQNLSTTHREEIRERNEIFVPAGDGRTNFVDVRDLGEVAALVLQGEAHINKAYELTCSRAYSYAEIAGILSQVLHREIHYRNPSVFSFFWRKWREGHPAGFVVVMVALYSVARFGKAAGYSPELEQLLGRPPLTFEQFAEDHKGVWEK
ncbi:SDR family oxidoreductase [soil metagenome]